MNRIITESTKQLIARKRNWSKFENLYSFLWGPRRGAKCICPLQKKCEMKERMDKVEVKDAKRL